MRIAQLCSISALLVALPAYGQQALDTAVENDLSLTTYVSNLNVPVGAKFLPDGRLVIIEQFSGNIRLWNGTQLTTIGNISVQTSGERGLLGLAVDPEFATSRRLYFYFSAGGAQRVGYALMDAQTDQVDTANLTVLLEGMAANRNHNGGSIEFGPDGYLYIGVGDTGCNCGCGPGTNTNNFFPTCLTSLHGKILRLDRDGGIPATNPLVGVNEVTACGTGSACTAADDPLAGTGAPRTEIYNWGFRNPWRFSFDAETGFLWVGDVGEVTYEEITVSTGPGQHHGWPYREGAHGQALTTCATATSQSGDCRDPAFEYPHNETPASGSASVTGGVFSHHCSWPEAWRGLYWFADYNKNRVWTLTPNANRDGVTGGRTIIVRNAGGPVHFTVGPDGAIYYINITFGEIMRLAPAAPATCDGEDAGTPTDAGSPADANDPPVDAGTPADAAPGPDASPPADAALPPDASAPADATAGADATPAEPDGGGADAGLTADAGDGAEEEGCGCDAADGARSAPWLGLGLIAALSLGLRRRRRG